MSTVLNLAKMSATDKLRALDEIWSDLLQHPEQIPFQQWHKDLLDERQRMVTEGKAHYIPWEQAKKEIADEIARGRSE